MLSETKLNVLKQISGDLSRDEAIWASGYLAGLAGGTLTATLPPQQQDIPVQNAVKNHPGLRYGNRKQQKTGNRSGRNYKEKRNSGKTGRSFPI